MSPGRRASTEGVVSRDLGAAKPSSVARPGRDGPETDTRRTTAASRRMTARRWASRACMVAVLGCALDVSAKARPKVQHVSAQGRVQRGGALVLGSSSVNGTWGRLLAKGIAREGYTVLQVGVASSGFSRPDYFDWSAYVRTLQLPRRTLMAVVYVGGNDAQALRLLPGELPKRRRRWLGFGHRAWPKLYARRVAAFAKALCRRGVRRVVFLPPVDVGKPRLQQRLRPVRRGLRRGARRVRCATLVNTAGDARVIRRARPRLRQPDRVHLTRAGAARVWRRVKRRVQSSARRAHRMHLVALKRARLAKRRAARLARKRAVAKRRRAARAKRRAAQRRARAARVRAQRRARRAKRARGRRPQHVKRRGTRKKVRRKAPR